MSYTAEVSFIPPSEGARKQEWLLLMFLYYCRLFSLKRDFRTLLDEETVLEKKKKKMWLLWSHNQSLAELKLGCRSPGSWVGGFATALRSCLLRRQWKSLRVSPWVRVMAPSWLTWGKLFLISSSVSRVKIAPVSQNSCLFKWDHVCKLFSACVWHTVLNRCWHYCIVIYPTFSMNSLETRTWEGYGMNAQLLCLTINIKNL